jgi:hypothetical protein
MLMTAILPTRAATFLADGAEVPAHALADRLQGVTCARPASNCVISATQRAPPEKPWCRPAERLRRLGG